MGKDCESWFHQQEPPWRKPNLDRPNPMPYLRQPSILAGYTNPYACMVSASGSLPRLVVSESPYLKTGLENELNGWSYSLSRNRQALATNRDLVHNEKKLSGDSLLNSVSGPVQNGLFAYDQIKNQSNMIFGSMNDYSIQRLISENQKPFDTMNGSCVEDQASKRDMIYGSENVISSGLDENQETGETESEMHEDTEELDALLYSEGDSEFDDDDDEDDDEISTGHSPCEFTVHHTKKQQQTEGIAEEVASSIGRSKRKRLLEEDEKNSLKDTASSMKLNSARKLEDDAESSCVKGRTVVVEEEESDSVQSNKRLKKEKIRLAVRILQSIIPGGGKGKDAIFVLDEAIHYLRSMKAQN